MAERHKILVEDRDRSISENNNLGVGKKSPDPFPSSNGSQPNDANKMLRIDTFGSDASGNSGEEPEIDLDAVSYFDDFCFEAFFRQSAPKNAYKFFMRVLNTFWLLLVKECLPRLNYK